MIQLATHARLIVATPATGIPTDVSGNSGSGGVPGGCP
jgi:hypothetical protein